jgi:hypothetical protein
MSFSLRGLLPPKPRAPSTDCAREHATIRDVL